MWDLKTIKQMNEPPTTVERQTYQRVLDGRQIARRQVYELRGAIVDAIEQIDDVEIVVGILTAVLDSTAPTAVKPKGCGCD